MTASRRTFLQQATTAGAALFGATVLPLRRLDTRLSADAVLKGVLDDDIDVRALALRALDTAKAAGAQYADVRINQSQTVGLGIHVGSMRIDQSPMESLSASVGDGATFGVRAVVNGAWGFAGGSTLTPEGIDRVAKLAVAYARDGWHIDATPWEYATAPVVPDGHWETPCEIDPFTLPIAEIVQVYRDGMTEARKVKGAASGGGPGWNKSERIFASTEGSVITQRLIDGNSSLWAVASHPNDRRVLAAAGVDIPSGQYGYELLAKADLKTAWPKAMEEAIRKSKLPYKSAEVGRYDIVFSADALSQMLLPTGRALELDRALGEKANDDGTTFAMPPADTLGTYKVGTKLITITADRSRPHADGTTGWDEEGVKPEDFTLVQDGVVMDYVTTRATAPKLAEWYRKQNRSVRSHGCAARTGRLQPILQLPNLTLKPGPGATSVEDLIKDVKQGYYLEDSMVSSDQQQINIQLGAFMAHEIVNGKLGTRVIDLAVQFALPRFWQNVTVLGGADSGKLGGIGVDDIDGDRLVAVGAWAVPGLVKQLNVISTGKEA